MKRYILAAIAILPIGSAQADCHRYTRWYYPWPQHCGVHLAQTAIVAPNPPPKPIYLELPGNPDIDIPLPSLENIEFPPDCLADWCQRLKGVGLLRQENNTN